MAQGNIVDQIQPDGAIVRAAEPALVLFRQQRAIIEQGAAARAWNVAFVTSNEEKRYHKVRFSKGGASFEAILYIFPNLAYSKPRAEAEKRIQLTRDHSEHDGDFALPKDGNPRCALMGIYQRGPVTLFAAWDAEAYVNHGTNRSVYVRADALSSAQRSGFGQGFDQSKRLVCCFPPDMLPYYLENMKRLHDEAKADISPIVPDEDKPSLGEMELPLDLPAEPNGVPNQWALNRIVYGAPGTGKSHRVDANLAELFPNEGLYERTTFYPDTTNGIFLGEYKPSPVYRRTEDELVAADRSSNGGRLEPLIDYAFVVGPFLRMLARAIAHPTHAFALVIEEINRAHASAVFGDVFQMLDRDADGTGKFSVTLSAEARNYLAERGIRGAVRIPKNLYIWATMNSADQGILPMDAAFRRRWSLEYVGINEGEAAVADWDLALRFRAAPIKWNEFRRKVNAHLEKQSIAEDRLLGPFFVTPRDLASPKVFEDKILQYLRDDVMRSSPGRLFKAPSLSYGALVETYRSGKSIFVPEVGLDGDA